MEIKNYFVTLCLCLPSRKCHDLQQQSYVGKTFEQGLNFQPWNICLLKKRMFLYQHFYVETCKFN